MDKDKQALREKLAIWRGFEWWSLHPQEDIKAETIWRPAGGCEVLMKDANGDMPILERIEGLEWIAAPNFPQSLDACFKWLVPKLSATMFTSSYQLLLIRWVLDFTYDDKEPALALCLAIEKLIDGEK